MNVNISDWVSIIPQASKVSWVKIQQCSGILWILAHSVAHVFQYSVGIFLIHKFLHFTVLWFFKSSWPMEMNPKDVSRIAKRCRNLMWPLQFVAAVG